MEEVENLIIGGGACGLMCAVQAGYLGKDVLLLEKNSRPGAKILISGGGRCNFTNLQTGIENFVSENPAFARSVFSQWTVDDTIAFFSSYGIEGQEKTLGQLFPVSNKASDVVALFEQSSRDSGQQIRCNADVRSVEKLDDGRFKILYLHEGRERNLICSNLVMASGGLAVKKMGATDFALQIARSFDLTISRPAPALVPLVVTGKEAAWFESLSGNSFFARVSLGTTVFEENILFTHWGLSGPAILQVSSYWAPGQEISIDLLPGHDLELELKKAKSESGKKAVSTVLTLFFTRRFIDSLAGMLPLNKTIGDLSQQDIKMIANFVHRFKFKPAGDKGYDKAEVMRGGLSTSELFPKTLECKKVPGLYFGGEAVDMTGWLGGYNFQWAWACGFVIAQNL